VVRNGPADPADRLVSHVHVSVDGVDGEALTFALDRAGLEVSAGAACASGAGHASPVLDACGIDADAALRLSLGWTTTEADVDEAVAVVTEVVTRLRARGGGFVPPPAVPVRSAGGSAAR
jgi:cysteine desulfurase